MSQMFAYRMVWSGFYLVHSFLLYMGYQCHLKERRNMAEVAGGSRALIHVSVALWVALNSQLED